MPRSENPLDPQAGPVAAFASDLRALRHQAGHMTYRVMAKRTGYSVTTLSVAASGASLPSLEVTLAYVQACGGDPQQWRDRWRQTSEQRQPRQAAVESRAAGIAESGGAGTVAVVPAAPPQTAPAPAPAAAASSASSTSRWARARRRPGFWAVGAMVEAGLLVIALVGLTYGRTAQASPPAASVSGSLESNPANEPAQGRCTMPSWDPSPLPVPGLIQDDVQHLSTWVMWPSPSGVPIILHEATPTSSSSITLGQLSDNIEDGFTADYADGRPADGDVPNMTLNVATPKTGICMTQLIYYAEVGLSTGRQDTNPNTLTFLAPGPLLKAAHAVLLCSKYYVPVGIPTTCAWAGPVNAPGTPFFGQFWIHPETSGPVQQSLGPVTADYADQLFGALNAKPSRSEVLSQ